MITTMETNDLQLKYSKVFRFLRQKGLQMRHARVGNQFMPFFRNDELQRIVEQYQDQLKVALNSLESPLEELRKGLVFLERPVNARALKYPTALTYSREQAEFAALPFDISESLTMMVASTLIAVIFIVFLPNFPFIIRYWVWKSCLYTLLLLGAVLLVRVAVALAGWILGLRLRLIPNLLLDTDLKHRIRPVLTCTRQIPIQDVVRRFLSVWMMFRFVYLAVALFKKCEQGIKDFLEFGITEIGLFLTSSLHI